MKTFLDVPFGEKEAAKAKGARWDPAAKKWYCPDSVDLAQFKKWLPSHLQKWCESLPKRKK